MAMWLLTRIYCTGGWNKLSRKGEKLEELYLQALTEGSTLDRTVRVMFVGHKGAGKTTLCRRFLGENITSIRSTEGIDVYIEKFTVDLETRKWTIDVEGKSMCYLHNCIYSYDSNSCIS